MGDGFGMDCVVFDAGLSSDIRLASIGSVERKVMLDRKYGICRTASLDR